MMTVKTNRGMMVVSMGYDSVRKCLLTNTRQLLPRNILPGKNCIGSFCLPSSAKVA